MCETSKYCREISLRLLKSLSAGLIWCQMKRKVRVPGAPRVTHSHGITDLMDSGELLDLKLSFRPWLKAIMRMTDSSKTLQQTLTPS